MNNGGFIVVANYMHKYFVDGVLKVVYCVLYDALVSANI
jgi:hypothetical protein